MGMEKRNLVIYELGGGFHFDQRDRDCGVMVIDYRWLLGARLKAMELLGLLMHKRERSTPTCLSYECEPGNSGYKEACVQIGR